MREFKSSLLVIIQNIFYGVFGGAALAVIAYIFLPYWVSLLIGAAAMAYLVYCAVFGDRIRVVVDDERFYVYRRKTLKHEFARGEVSLYARVKTTNTDSDCTLTVEDAEGQQTSIDCSLLGASRFYALLAALDVTDGAPVSVRTNKKA